MRNIPIQRVLVLVALAFLVAATLQATRDPRPALVQRFGGTRLAWDAVHRANYGAATRCLRFADTTPNPTVQIWILPDSTPPLAVDSTFRFLRGMYDQNAKAIVLHPSAGPVGSPDYWKVFRHEAVHERVGDGDHLRWEWGEAKRCGFVAPVGGTETTP